MIPFQNSKGKNGAMIVSVPANTGIKTSPAAAFAAFAIGTFPFSYSLCVFSTTTIASSTMIPNPKSSANNTIKLRVTSEPTIISAIGRNKNATNTLRGTLRATKKALVTPIKNIKIISTNKNPMMIVLTNSSNEVAACLLWSPVMTTFRSFGNSEIFISSTIFLICAAQLIRFSPGLFTMFRVTTFLPFSLA